MMIKIDKRKVHGAVRSGWKLRHWTVLWVRDFGLVGPLASGSHTSALPNGHFSLPLGRVSVCQGKKSPKDTPQSCENPKGKDPHIS